MEKSLFEQVGGTYTQVGDYLLPNLTLTEEAQKSIGIWGQQHARYLKQYHKVIYYNYLTSGKLNAYLADIDEQAEEMFSRLVKDMAEKQGMGQDVRIAVRVTAKEKERIQAKARKCGLSTTEYVKQRALGCEPRAVPPDALFVCLERLGELADKASSPELDEEIGAVLKQITAEFLLPGKG